MGFFSHQGVCIRLQGVYIRYYVLWSSLAFVEWSATYLPEVEFLLTLLLPAGHALSGLRIFGHHYDNTFTIECEYELFFFISLGTLV